MDLTPAFCFFIWATSSLPVMALPFTDLDRKSAVSSASVSSGLWFLSVPTLDVMGWQATSHDKLAALFILCSLNLCLVEGILEGAGAQLSAALEPDRAGCCVAVR